LRKLNNEGSAFKRGLPFPDCYDVPKKELLVVIPFIGKLSLKLRTRLQSAFKVLPQCKVKVIFQSTCRLSSFFRFKDVIPKSLRSNLVYKFSCGSCNATYYGKTIRHFKVRASEHIGLTPLTGKRVKNPKLSAILDHHLLTNHIASFDDFKVLSTETNEFRLLIKESLLIARDKPQLNNNIYSVPLKLFN